MDIIIGHDIVVQEMEGSYWNTLKILLFLREQRSAMDLRFIHSLLEVSLFLSFGHFGLPSLAVVVEIRPKTDV